MEKNGRQAFYLMEVQDANSVSEPMVMYAKDWTSAKRTAVRCYKAFCGTVLYLSDHLDKDGYVPKQGSLFRGKDGKWVEMK